MPGADANRCLFYDEQSTLNTIIEELFSIVVEMRRFFFFNSTILIFYIKMPVQGLRPPVFARIIFK